MFTLDFGNNLNISTWFWQTSVVAGSRLYISGGELYNSTANSSHRVDLPKDIVIDLTKSWTNATIPATLIEHDEIPTVRRPMLWYDSSAKKIYRYGGWPYTTGSVTDTYSQYLWSFPINDSSDPASTSWSSSVATGENGLGEDGRAPGGAAYTFSNTTFYALGGSCPSTWSAPVQGLVEFNNTGLVWQNQSSVGATSTGYWAMAAAAFTPNYGSRGFLIFVGGTARESGPGKTSTSDLINMSLVSLYDIATQTWYQQATTGTTPKARSSFCYASTSSENSFEIFIYGGDTSSDPGDTDSDTSYLNVWALSIPAFRWFQSSGGSTVRRANHHCTVIGNRQMVSIGGSVPGDVYFGETAEPWTNGIGIFDMTAFKWSSSYDVNAAPYDSPSVVKEYYSSSFTTPSWSNPTLGQAFAEKNSTTSTSSPTSSSSSPTSSPSSSSSSGTNTGAVAGGVIGGVAVLGIIAAFFLFFRRRRRHETVMKDNHSGSLRPAEGYAMGEPLAKPYTDSPNAQAAPEPNTRASPAEIDSDSHPIGQSRFHELSS